jgi:hypothetical protein
MLSIDENRGMPTYAASISRQHTHLHNVLSCLLVTSCFRLADVLQRWSSSKMFVKRSILLLKRKKLSRHAFRHLRMCIPPLPMLLFPTKRHLCWSPPRLPSTQRWGRGEGNPTNSQDPSSTNVRGFFPLKSSTLSLVMTQTRRTLLPRTAFALHIKKKKHESFIPLSF